MLVLVLSACIHFPAAPKIVARPEGHAPSVLIHDVRVFSVGDPLYGEPLVREHVDVRFADGVITDVRPAWPCCEPEPPDWAITADVTISGEGRTLMPGLVDLHVHLALGAAPPWFLTVPDPPHAAQAMAWAGVTTVLDLGGSSDTLHRVQRQIAARRWVGPRIRYAGPGLTVADAYPLDMTKEIYGALAFSAINGHHFIAVTDIEDIETQVDRIADSGATFIKLMAASIPAHDPPTPRLSEAMMKAATARAHARGLRVAAHIDTAEDALICARVGVDLLAHGVETSLLTADQLATLKASGIAFEPTLVNWQRFDELAAGELRPSASELATQSPAVLASFSPELLLAHRSVLDDSTFKSWADALKAHHDDRIANTLAMFNAGIPLQVGSDSNGSIGTFPGSFHEELRLLVDAGVPTLDVLAAATHGNALFLDGRDLDGDRHPDVDAPYGRVHEGYAADLVLVDGDPTTDIRHTEDIVQVWVGGAPIR